MVGTDDARSSTCRLFADAGSSMIDTGIDVPESTSARARRCIQRPDSGHIWCQETPSWERRRRGPRVCMRARAQTGAAMQGKRIGSFAGFSTWMSFYPPTSAVRPSATINQPEIPFSSCPTQSDSASRLENGGGKVDLEKSLLLSLALLAS